MVALRYLNRPAASSPNPPRLSDETKLSLIVAAACLVVGGLGFFADCLFPGSTQLGGLLIVGAYYLLFAVARWRRPSLVQASQENADAPAPQVAGVGTPHAWSRIPGERGFPPRAQAVEVR